MEDAAAALRAGRLAAAHVLTRREARPDWIDGLPPEDVELLRRTPLGALFWPLDDPLRGEWLIPLDPAKARALLAKAVDDRGPAHLALAFLDPDAARAQKRETLLTPFAAAAALQWDAGEAAALLDRQRNADRSPGYVAGQAFDLWNAPYARNATPEELAPFLARMSRGRRRTAHRRLFLRLRAAGAAVAPPELLPPEDETGPVDDEAALAAADGDRLPELLCRWTPGWLLERWPSIRAKLDETGRPVWTRLLFERLAAAGRVEAGLLESLRPSWIHWAEALRALARFRPEAARAEAARAPASHRTATLQRVIEGEADARLFEVRLAALRRVAGDEDAVRAALWLLLGEPPRWHDEGRLMQALVALGETPVERPFWRLLFEDTRDIIRPDLRQAILNRG